MYRIIALIFALAGIAALACAAVDVPVRNWQPALMSGFEAKAAPTPQGIVFTFKKAGEERRLLAARGTLAANPAGALAAEIQYEVALTAGEAPRLALIVWEKNGGSWYKVSSGRMKLQPKGQGRLSLAGLIPTAFSQDKSGKLEWNNVQQIWIGFLFDGPAAGRAAIISARFTDTPVVPTEPVTLIDVTSKWNDSHDPAVKTKISTPNEGPAGKPCFKYEFEVPAGRHMFACPNTFIIADDLEGYKALRMTIRGEIPAGMRLLIQISEQGGPVYYVERAAEQLPAEWTELVIPLSEFKPASWAPKDDNGQLDLAKLNTLSIGSHGTAQQARQGLIMACDVEMIP